MTEPISGRYRPVAPLPTLGGVERELAIDQVADHRVAMARIAGGEQAAAVERSLEAVKAIRHASLAPVLDVARPEAGFYLWAGVPGGDDVAFARSLLAQYNVAVLPGSLLARPMPPSAEHPQGWNPGQGRIRLALVAPLDECVQAAQRIVEAARKPS